MRRSIVLFAVMAGLVHAGGCGKKPEEKPSAEPTPAPSIVFEEAAQQPAPAIAAATPAESPAPPKVSPSAPPATVADDEGALWPDIDAPTPAPEKLAGAYRDRTVPDVTYELKPDGTWQATWESADGKKGIRMTGTYKIEYGMARLLCQAAVRKDLLSGDYTRPKKLPAPHPRCMFRIADGSLLMVPDMADPPFVLEPFTAVQLEKVQR